MKFALLLLAGVLPHTLDLYTGHWKLDAAASDNIEKAIETAIEPMNFLSRPIARGKLRRRSVAFPNMTITKTAEGFHVVHEQGLNVVYTDIATPVHVKSIDGEDIVSTLTGEPSLTLTYKTSAGERTDQYLLSDDGKIVSIQVRVTSRSLPQPLQYRLVYHRAD
jgi:hypothetical protein